MLGNLNDKSVGSESIRAFEDFYMALYACPVHDVLPDLVLGPPDPLERMTVFDVGDLVKCISEMNAQSSVGPEGISVAMLKGAGKGFLEVLLDVFVGRLRGDLTEVNWKSALVTLLPKVSDAARCKDFRPVSVLPVLFKLYEKWLLCISLNLDPDLFARLPAEHHGFRPGFQICEALLVTRIAIERSLEYEMPLVCVKLDVVKAFDRVKHRHWTTGNFTPRLLGPSPGRWKKER